MIKNILNILLLTLTNTFAGNFLFISNLNSSITLPDTPKTYTTKEIFVLQKKEFNDHISSGFLKVISLTEQLTSVSVGNLLSSKPGIFTKSYGSEGSLQTISIRGAGSEYTSVFINGVNYNNSLNGVFDFSKFSSDEIAEIIIKKGNDFDPLNNNSFGGVIELIPFEKNDTLKSQFKFQTGSFGYQAFHLKTAGSFLNNYYKINLTHKSANNDYKYSFNNETAFRKNSDVNQNSFNLAVVNHLNVFNKPFIINSFISFLDKKLGLPNFVSTNRHHDSGTREREKTLTSTFNTKAFIADEIYLNAIFGLHHNHLSIDDPLLSINLKTKYFDLKDNSINSKVFLNIQANKFFISGGVSAVLENFDKNEKREDQNSIFENLNRKTFSSNFKVNYTDLVTRDITLNSALFLSYNFVSNIYKSKSQSYQFPNFRIGVSFKSNQHNLITFANAGSGIRVPNFYEYSFNKLTSLSGKELEPEKIFNYEIGSRFENENVMIEFTYFTFDVQNKIIWRPQRVAFFSPINSGKVKSSGIELSFERLKISNNFYFGANYTMTNALKKTRLSHSDNSYNKQIPYIPRHKASISINFVSKFFETDFNANYYGKRYTTEDNDDLFSLEPVVISNISTTVHKNIRQFSFRINFLVQNLFNTSYQLIQSFPMPGREYRLTIQMEV